MLIIPVWDSILSGGRVCPKEKANLELMQLPVDTVRGHSLSRYPAPNSGSNWFVPTSYTTRLPGSPIAALLMDLVEPMDHISCETWRSIGSLVPTHFRTL